MKELIELFEARRRALDVPYAVATVLRVEGSSYRRPGARMLISVNGRVAGSVSGGCLERAVIAEGQRALLDGAARLLYFDTTDQDDLAFGSNLGCQGKIWIGIEVLAAGEFWPLEKIVESVRRRRKPAAVITKIDGSGRSLRYESSAVFPDFFDDDAALRWDIAAVLQTRKTRFVGAEMVGSHLTEWMGPPVML